MLVFSTSITIDGLQVMNPLEERIGGTKAWGLANSLFCPLGPAPTRAFFLMQKREVNQLDLNAPHTVAWNMTASDNADGSSPTTTSLTFNGLYVVKAERLLHGAADDFNALYLVELADGRYIAAMKSDSGVVQANLRSYANTASYLTGTTTYGTWDNLLSALWIACGTLGSYPGLPGGLPIDGAPENTWVMGKNAYRTLNAILDQLDCAIEPDPFSLNFSIVQLGSNQTIPDEAATLKWNGQPFTPTATQSAASLAFYHCFHYQAYGQERDTELANNWAVNGEGTINTLATNITGGKGTLAFWDDLSVILDEYNQPTNTSSVNTRDSNRKTRYVTRMGVSNQHRIHTGLLNTLTPGGKIRATIWRNLGDGKSNMLGGTVTEFIACNDFVNDFRRSGGPDTPTWFDRELFPPEREQYAPPDLGRRSYPNYPRLPNIVQVSHAGGTAGNSVQPDATANPPPNGGAGVSLHSGYVKRFVGGGMATLDPCWILFVDNFDVNNGNVQAIQGEYYGPARLSGVATVSTQLLPVYTVRNGSLAAAKEMVVFEITSTGTPALGMTGFANAKICYLDPLLGEYVGSNAQADQIVVTDFYRNEGEWQGLQGYRGVAKRRTDSRYDVIWMERPALITETTTVTDMAGSSTTADSQNMFHYQQGEKVPWTVPELQDPNGFFPLSLKGAKSLSFWNDRRRELELFLSQQQGLYASARLQDVLTADQTDNVRFSDFRIQTFSPFNQTPTAIAANQGIGTAFNYFHMHGEPGDEIWLVWFNFLGKWIIIQVDQDQRNLELLTLHPDNGSGNLQQSGSAVDSSLFVGYTVTPFINNNLLNNFDASFDKSRPCIIQISDFALASDPGEAGTGPILEFGRVYGPGKWVGILRPSLAGFSFAGADSLYPVYRCTVGEQGWFAKCATNLNKGQPGNFFLYDNDLNVTSVEVLAISAINDYTADMLAWVSRKHTGPLIANQVECG